MSAVFVMISTFSRCNLPIFLKSWILVTFLVNASMHSCAFSADHGFSGIIQIQSALHFKLCVFVCAHVQLSTGSPGGNRALGTGGIDNYEMLAVDAGNYPWPSASTLCVLNHRAISPSLIF